MTNQGIIMDKNTVIKLLFIVSLSLVCMSCSGDREHADLNLFMKEVRSHPQGEIEPLPTFRMYESFKYSVAAFRSPFEKPLAATADNTGGKTAVEPDENRAKEYLEDFNISAISLVGTMKKGEVIWSLINDGEGSVHRVTLGNYLGKNHGKIVAVSPSQIDLIEIVPDGKTGWVERPRALALKEND